MPVPAIVAGALHEVGQERRAVARRSTIQVTMLIRNANTQEAQKASQKPFTWMPGASAQREVEQQRLGPEPGQEDADPAQKQGEGRQQRPQQGPRTPSSTVAASTSPVTPADTPGMIQIVKAMVSQPRISVTVSRRISAQVNRRPRSC